MESSVDSLVGSVASITMDPSTYESVPASASASAAFDKPGPPADLSHHYSETTKQRIPSKMKEAYKFFQIPGIGNLAGGLPNVQFFPYDTLEAQIAKPERWTPSAAVDPSAATAVDDVASSVSTLKVSSASSNKGPADRLAPAHLLVPKSAELAATPDKKIDLATALQYGTAEGYPPLVAFIREFVRDHLHTEVPYEGGPEVILTVGSTDGFSKTLELFVNNWNPSIDITKRPGILCETFVYGNVLSQAAPRGVQPVPVAADDLGMIPYGPGGLDDVLSNWDPSKGLRPHLMYTVTMGHNPTGIVLGVKRRKEIYAVCSHHDVIIIEDDPYWYLQFPTAAYAEAASRNQPAPTETALDVEPPVRSSGYAFLDSLVPSFLRFDTDGRVVRLDTFSKTVAPGCRLGWITAQPELIERFTRITETSTQQPSGFVQSLIVELLKGPLPVVDKDGAAAVAAPTSRLAQLGQLTYASRTTKNKKSAGSFDGWQTDGWVRWLEGLRGEYERRMGLMCTILDEGSFQLKQGTPVRPSDADWGVITKTKLFSFDWPRGGMFIWIRVHFEQHPLWQAPRPGKAGKGGAVFDGLTFNLAMMIHLTSKPFLVLVSPGTMFSATDEIRSKFGWAYFRVCFAAESDENIELCSKRLVAGIQKFWKIKKAEDLEDVLENEPAAMADAATAQEAGELGNLGPWLGC